MSDHDIRTVEQAVRVSRPIFAGLQDVLANIPRKDLTNPSNVESVSDKYDELREWLNANWDKYLQGLDNGFAIRRYRVSLYYPDGRATTIRESEDKSAIGNYANQLIASYKSRGYFCETVAGDGTGIYTSDKSRKHCTLRVEIIKSAPATKDNQRDPEQIAPVIVKDTDWFIAARRGTVTPDVEEVEEERLND